MLAAHPCPRQWGVVRRVDRFSRRKGRLRRDHERQRSARQGRWVSSEVVWARQGDIQGRGLSPSDFPDVASNLSQKQLRHIRGRKEHLARGGGFLDSVDDAQLVLDSYRAGKTTVIGRSSQGFPVVRFEGVMGTNVNKGAGITSQPTHVFMIKGTAKPSVVPMSPGWRPFG